MTFRKTLILCIILGSVVTSLKANYYQPDLFPIGLTGINGTGGNPPYSNAGIEPAWDWDRADGVNSEKHLIFDLGVNVIGCQDAQARYIGYTDPNRTVFNDYIHKVCKNAGAPGTDSAIYVITVSYYVSNDNDTKGAKFDTCTSNDCSVICYDSTGYMQWKENHADGMFRSPTRGNYPGFGDMQFSHYDGSGTYNCHGTQVDNWETFDGKDTWRAQADIAITNFRDFLRRFGNSAPYVWGYNLITEDPAVYRNTGGNPAWHGCWAGVDYLFTGHGIGTSNYNYFRDLVGEPGYDLHYDSLGGIRGIEDSVGIDHRMFVAKGGPSTLHQGGYNIFEALPDLDAFLKYSHWWCKVKHNYGEQTIFDEFLYGNSPGVTGGRHNDAIYMQEYGKTNLAYTGQRRRFIAVIDVSWYTPHRLNNGGRRPCPPEIRCGSYLALSRGAKGIFFHGWSMGISDEYPGSTIQIPSATAIVSANVGIRDHKGFPFGDTNSPDSDYHYLNSSAPQASYWNHAKDTTYAYLANHLVDELKELGKVLVHLDWVNAYSLKSTVGGKGDDCPHMYVKSITTNRDGYIDLAFFDSTGSSSEYFMVVNRDDIDSMRSATFIITLDGTCWPAQRLLLTDMGDSTSVANPDTLNRSGTVFVDTVVFEPGEGKLFRINNLSGPGIYKPLTLWGIWKESRPSPGYMDTLSSASFLGWAYCQWRWMKNKPATLEDMSSWGHPCDESEWDNVPTDHIPLTDRDWDYFWALMTDSCMRYLELGEHPDGKDTIDTDKGNKIGTKSNEIQITVPGSSSGCPDLYSFFYQDTSVSPGHVFMENNTILPHSQHVQAIDEDLLKLDVLNTDPDHYYLSIVENSNSTSYLDQVKLWVADHDEDEQVATSADDSIYVYSDMVGPASCTDRGNNDRLDQILWEDTASFAGPAGSYLTIKFSDPGWTYAGLLISLGDRSETAPPPKDYLSIPSEPGGGGTWDSLGVAYGRMNPSQWLVDVSDCDSLTFRVYCGGSDTCFIDRIALVKLEPSGWSLTEADLDSAVLHNPSSGSTNETEKLFFTDTFHIVLHPTEQISLRFDKVDTSATYPVRDFVFQSRGYYIPINPPGSPQSGVEEEPLEFGIVIEQIEPLSRNAFINYSVPYMIHVKIGIYDVSGRLVKTVVNDKVNPGRYSEQWPGIDNAGRRVASGIYFIKMETEDYKQTHKIVVLK